MTDKITFFTSSDDNISVESPNLNTGWGDGEAKFTITLPMDGVTARGAKTVGYVVGAAVRFGQHGWEFELETPEGVRIERVD